MWGWYQFEISRFKCGDIGIVHKNMGNVYVLYMTFERKIIKQILKHMQIPKVMHLLEQTQLLYD